MPTDLNLANDFFLKQQVPVSQNIQSESAELARRANLGSYQSTPEYIGGIGGFGKDERYDYGIASNQLPALNRIRADIQPWTTQAGAFLNQAVVGEVIGGTIMSLGALLDAPEMIANKLEGSEEDFHNTIFDIGKSISDWTQEKTPIYQTGERFSDSGWWFQNMVSVASAASMMAPGMGVAKGLGALTKAAKLSTIASDIVGTVGGSLAMRHAENFREASGVYDNLYKTGIEKLNNGEIQGDEETVRRAASEGAALDYSANYTNLAFDMIQLGAVLKPLKGLTRNVGKPAYAVARAEGILPETRLGKIGYWLESTGKSQLLPQLSEGLEEGINQISQYEGERKGRIEMGIEKDDNTTLGNRIGEYLGRPETIDAMMWGAVGGLAFKGAAMATGFDESNSQINKKLGELASRQATLQSYNKFIDAAVNNRQVTNDDGDLIADFTNITPGEKTDIVNDLQDKAGFDLGFNAAKAQNTDMLLRQIESEDFKNDIIELGWSTKETVNQDINKLKDGILQGERLYQKHYTRLFNKPIDGNVKNRIINEAVNTDYKREQNLDRIKELESNYMKMYNKDPMVQMFKGDPIFDNTIKQYGYTIAENTINNQIEQYKSNNKDGVNDKNIEHLNKLAKILQDNKTKLGKINVTDPKMLDSNLISNFAEQEILKADTMVLSEKLANDDTKENIEAKENEIKETKESVKQNISENKVNAEKEAKSQRLAQEKLNRDLDNLAEKLYPEYNQEVEAFSTKLTERENELFDKYNKEVISKFNKIRANKETPEERFLNKSFDRIIGTISDEDFMDSFESMMAKSNEVIENAIRYKESVPNLSDDEEKSLGDIMKREVRKKRILNKKLIEVSERLASKNNLGQLEEKSSASIEEDNMNRRNEIRLTFDLTQVVQFISEDGRTISIGGKVFHNLYSNPEMAANLDSNGNIISINLTDDNGNIVEFTDENIVDGVYYQILLLSTNDSFNPHKEVNASEVETEVRNLTKKEHDNKSLFTLHRMLDEALEALDEINSNARRIISEYEEIGFTRQEISKDEDIVLYVKLKKEVSDAISEIEKEIELINSKKPKIKIHETKDAVKDPVAIVPKKENTVEEVNIKVEEPYISNGVVSISDDGRMFNIKGSIFHNMYSLQEMAINFDDNGNAISINLTDDNGNGVEFTDENIVDPIVYQIILSSISEKSYKDAKKLYSDFNYHKNKLSKNKSNKEKLYELYRMIDEANSIIDEVRLNANKLINEYRSIGISDDEIMKDEELSSYKNIINNLKNNIKTLNDEINSIKNPTSSVKILNAKKVNENNRAARKKSSNTTSKQVAREESERKDTNIKQHEERARPTVQSDNGIKTTQQQPGLSIQPNVQQKGEFIDNEQPIVDEQNIEKSTRKQKVADIEKRRNEELLGGFEINDIRKPKNGSKVNTRLKINSKGDKISFEGYKEDDDTVSVNASYPKLSLSNFRNSEFYKNLKPDSKELLESLISDLEENTEVKGIELTGVRISKDERDIIGKGNSGVTVNIVTKDGKIEDISLASNTSKINAKYDAELANLNKSNEDKHLDNQIKTEEQTKVVADDEFVDSDVISKINGAVGKLNQDLKNDNGSKTLNNDGTLNYENSMISNGHNALAHQDREYKRIKDGYEVLYQDVNDKLNDNAPVELLSGEIKVGDKVEFVVSDKDDIIIYDPDSIEKEPITWGVYKKRLADNNPGKDITKLSDYINNIPIQLKVGDKVINSYLHNTSWINEENVTGDIESDRIKLRDIRLKIVKDGKYTTSVSDISNGVLFILSNSKTHSLKEAVGEDINFKLAVGFKDGTLKIGDKKVFQEGVVNENIISGASYIISKLPNGKNIAIPVSNPKIGNIESKDIIKTNILTAIKAYLEQDKEVADNIRKVSGLEVRDIDGLETFIKMFIGMYNTNGQFLREMISSIPSESKNAYFTIHHNTIEFFTGNLNNGGGKVYSISIDTKDKILPTQNKLQDLFLDKLSKAIDDFYLNNSIESVDKNRNIPIFDGDKVELKPYKDLIMENFTTDVKGNRVGEVNGVPVYSYVIQPVYRFDFNDILAEQPSTNVSVETVTPPSSEAMMEVAFKSKLSAKERLAMRKLGIAANTVINKDNIKDSHKSCS